MFYARFKLAYRFSYFFTHIQLFSYFRLPATNYTWSRYEIYPIETSSRIIAGLCTRCSFLSCWGVCGTITIGEKSCEKREACHGMTVVLQFALGSAMGSVGSAMGSTMGLKVMSSRKSPGNRDRLPYGNSWQLDFVSREKTGHRVQHRRWQ